VVKETSIFIAPNTLLFLYEAIKNDFIHWMWVLQIGFLPFFKWYYWFLRFVVIYFNILVIFFLVGESDTCHIFICQHKVNMCSTGLLKWWCHFYKKKESYDVTTHHRSPGVLERTNAFSVASFPIKAFQFPKLFETILQQNPGPHDDVWLQEL